MIKWDVTCCFAFGQKVRRHLKRRKWSHLAFDECVCLVSLWNRKRQTTYFLSTKTDPNSYYILCFNLCRSGRLATGFIFRKTTNDLRANAWNIARLLKEEKYTLEEGPQIRDPLFLLTDHLNSLTLVAHTSVRKIWILWSERSTKGHEESAQVPLKWEASSFCNTNASTSEQKGESK